MEIAQMEVAKAKRVFLGRNVVVGLLGMVSIGMGTLFSGGCAHTKDDQIAQLNSEIAALKEEKAQAEQARIAAETKAQEAAARQSQQPQQPYDNGRMAYDNQRGGDNAPERDVVITVAGDVLFASGQTTLKPDAKKELDKIARDLQGKYSGHRIRVEGYTDSDPIKKSKFPSNEALSQARAESVEKYLISKGVSSDRISAQGMGSAKPKATKAASRRVEIVVVGR
jgi:outer membrane protein OmpA-like peptidoglycan-associated protein